MISAWNFFTDWANEIIISYGMNSAWNFFTVWANVIPENTTMKDRKFDIRIEKQYFRMYCTIFSRESSTESFL